MVGKTTDKTPYFPARVFNEWTSTAASSSHNPPAGRYFRFSSSSLFSRVDSHLCVFICSRPSTTTVQCGVIVSLCEGDHVLAVFEAWTLPCVHVALSPAAA